MDRLHRIRKLMGDAAVADLQNACVMVVGCGAVGSFSIEALARSGVGHLILIDADTVEESNINRQLFALTSTVGMPKIDVASARVHDINPEIHVDTIQTFYDENTQLDVRPDYIIDAIDTVPSKIALVRFAQSNNIPIISSMGAARKTDLTAIRIARLSRTSVCPLAARMRKLVRESGLDDYDVVFSTQPAVPGTADGRVFGSIATVTGAFGLHMANFVICRLAKYDIMKS